MAGLGGLEPTEQSYILDGAALPQSFTPKVRLGTSLKVGGKAGELGVYDHSPSLLRFCVFKIIYTEILFTVLMHDLII